MVNQMLNRANIYIVSATQSRELMARWVIAGAVVVSLLLPAMFALLQWIDEVLSLTSYERELVALLGDYAFEILVIILVTMFAMAILYALAAGAPELEIVIMGVALALVALGAWLLGETSNRCLTDLECDRGMYFVVVMMVFGMVIFGYAIPRSLGRSGRGFAIAFLAVAWWQAELWLWNALSRQGIPATESALRGVLLLFISVGLMALFNSCRTALREKDDKKKR